MGTTFDINKMFLKSMTSINDGVNRNQ